MIPRWRNVEFSSKGLLFQQGKGLTILVSWDILEVPPDIVPPDVIPQVSQSPQPCWQETCATSSTYWTLLWDNEPTGWDWPSCLPAAAVCLRGLDVYSGRGKKLAKNPVCHHGTQWQTMREPTLQLSSIPSDLFSPIKRLLHLPFQGAKCISNNWSTSLWNSEEPLHGCVLHLNPFLLGFPMLWPEFHESLWFFFLWIV